MSKEWINRSYGAIGKYFPTTSVADFYNQLKDVPCGYVHVHSMYSTSDSPQTTDEICEMVKELGGNSVTLTDHGTLLGIESFMKSGEKYNINTVPGIETYITMDEELIKTLHNLEEFDKSMQTRNHMVLFARNYKGYVDISHAMREANTNIVKVKGTKLENAIMTKEICERFFKNNADVIATTACIQGVISYILLTNERIKKKNNKEKERALKKVEAYENEYNLFKEKNPLLVAKKKALMELRKELRSYEKYTKPAHMQKIQKLEEKLSKSSETDKNYEKEKSNLENAKSLNSIAIKSILNLSNEIKVLESEIKNLDTEVKAVKSNALKYDKAKLLCEELESVALFKEDYLYQLAKKELEWFKETFSLGFVELQYHGIKEEAYVMPILVKLARELNIPLIAANDAHIKDNSEASIEARRIIRYNYFSKAQTVEKSDKELYLKSPNELSEWLIKVVDSDACYEALFNTKILETCKVVFPKEEHYPSVNSDVDFMDMIYKGRDERIKEGVIEKWTEEYQKRLEYEVKIMTEMGYVDYHKVVEDFCREGKLLGRIPKNEIANIPNDYNKVHQWIEDSHFPNGVGVGPGRGSGVGSLVCCCLGITNLDPIKYNLLFERFLNPERVSMPDIDTDIATRLRPTIIKYLKWKYGEKAVCSIATETTYAAKGAIQMAGRDRASQKYSGLPKKEYDEMTKRYLYDVTLKLSNAIPEGVHVTILECEEDIKPLIDNNKEMALVWERAKLIEGKLQGTGIHAGGVIISDNDNVNDYIPLAYNIEKDVWAAQCNMIVAEEKGLLKMDLLGLSTLDCLSDCMYLVHKYRGYEIEINKIKFEDEVFAEIYAKGRTNSVFQFESAGMKDMLKQFKPTCFEDIILLVACYRPGPMQYLENIIKVKNGEMELTYKTPLLEDILSATYGAVVYQEQVMQIFQKLAGYSLGGADLVRRAMSKKKVDVLEREREAFINGDIKRGIDGCVKRGVSVEIANELFDELMEFAKYAFNKSHAAAYAYVSYQTAWCKYHYQVEYICAMFNNKEQDKFAPLIEDCEIYGIELLQPDINRSYYDFVVDNGNIRYGIGGIKGIGKANINLITNICKNREEKLYDSVNDFLLRNSTIDENEKKSVITDELYNILVDAGMFDSLGYNRKELSKIKPISFIQGIEKIVPNDYNLKGETPLSYIMEKEVALLGTIISINPLKDYYNDEKYRCTAISDLKEDTETNILGFVASITKKKSKFGDNVYVMEVRGKNGKITIHTNKHLTSRFKEEDLLYKVLKFKGKVKYGRMFAVNISLANPCLCEHYAELDTAEKTIEVSKIINNQDEEGDVCIRLICYYVMMAGKMVKTDRPMITERWFTQDEVNILQSKGIDILADN